MEEVDAVVGIQNSEFAKLEIDEDHEDFSNNEVAIIGFWSLTEQGVFRCAHSFTVPNPMKREVVDIEGTVLCQILFGSKGDSLFFFFKQDSDLYLGVLDLESKQLDKATWETCELRKIEQNCRRFVKIKKDSILEKFIYDLNGKELANQKQMPNPSII